MRRTESDDDDLEPIDLVGSPTASAGTASRSAPALPSRPDEPRGHRLWFVTIGLAGVSMLQFAAAAYVGSIGADLRDLDDVWDDVAGIEADLQDALVAVDATATAYGDSPALAAQRDLVYDAAEARFGRLQSGVEDVSLGSRRLKSLKARMIETIVVRRRDFRAESVPAERADAVESITRELDAAFRRWHISPRATDEPPARLTAARELIERLDRMADGTTGLTIGAVAADGLYVIDVDDDGVRHHELQLSRAASVHPLGDEFVVVDGGVARAFRAPMGGGAMEPSWEAAADRGASTRDGTAIWLQAGTTLSRFVPDGLAVTMQLPQGARLVRARSTDTAVVLLADGSIVTTNGDGNLSLTADDRRVRSNVRDLERSYAVALDGKGRVMLAPIEDRPFLMYSTLRYPLPSFFSVAVRP